MEYAGSYFYDGFAIPWGLLTALLYVNGFNRNL